MTTAGEEAPPDTLIVVCLGGDELCTALGDGADLAASIARRVPRSPKVEVRHGPAGPLRELLADRKAWEDLMTDAHVVVRSISPDLALDPDGSETVRELGARFNQAFEELVTAVRPFGPTFVAVNGATFDPADKVSNYRPTGCTVPLAIHQLDLELIYLSIAEGISILDVDRLEAQLGEELGVESSLVYRAPLLAAMLDELSLILEEYGWFDERPILQQEGQRAKDLAKQGAR